jgi:hypothetical protein
MRKITKTKEEGNNLIKEVGGISRNLTEYVGVENITTPILSSTV